jgi:hypothetical protein
MVWVTTKQWCGFLLIDARHDLARLAKLASVMLRSSSHTHPLTHMHATHHMDQVDRAGGMSSIHASGGRAFLIILLHQEAAMIWPRLPQRMQKHSAAQTQLNQSTIIQEWGRAHWRM